MYEFRSNKLPFGKQVFKAGNKIPGYNKAEDCLGMDHRPAYVRKR